MAFFRLARAVQASGRSLRRNGLVLILGTALVASGFWFLVLPAPMVPPLLVISAVAGQVVGLIRLRGRMDWRQGHWLVSGG